MKKLSCIFSSIIISSSLNAQSISENFDNVFSIYTSGNWWSINNSNPNNGYIWDQDFGNFTAFSGPTNSSITAGWYCTDTVGTGDASVWLFTPPVLLNNGDTISFYTISFNNEIYPDRLELRLNTTGTDTSVGSTETSVGNFTTLLLTINPLLDTFNYPTSWTNYSVVLSGMTGNPGRIAFRYVVPNTGGSGSNGSVVAIDDFQFISTLTSIKQEQDLISFQLFPNPVSDKLMVKIAQFEKIRYRILDMYGKSVLSGNLDSSTSSINVYSLTKGIYQVELSTPTHLFTQKFIKQ